MSSNNPGRMASHRNDQGAPPRPVATHEKPKTACGAPHQHEAHPIIGRPGKSFCNGKVPRG